MIDLMEKLPDNIKQKMNEIAQKLLVAVQEGTVIDCRAGNAEIDDPEKADHWDHSRSINAEIIHYLCTEESIRPFVHYRGIKVIGARIDGELNFESATIQRPLHLVECKIGNLILTNADACAIVLIGSFIGKISAAHLSVKGEININNIKTNDEVSFMGAKINNDLFCSNALLNIGDGCSFRGDRMTVKGGIFVNGTKSKGEFRLLGANIGDSLNCAGTLFENEKGPAFGADGCNVAGEIVFRNCVVNGTARMVGSRIGANLSCDNAVFINPNNLTLYATQAHIGGSVFLQQIKSIGEIKLYGATINGDVACSKSLFEGSACIFNGDRISIGGNIFFNNITAKGMIHLLGANIGLNLDCRNSTIDNLGGTALAGDAIIINGSAFFRNSNIAGEIRLMHANIGLTLDFDGASLDNDTGTVINAEGMRVNNTFFFLRLKKLQGIVDFMHARVGQLKDDESGWPGVDKLILDHFRYEALVDNNTNPITVEKRIKWLRLQPKSQFRIQPYEHLVNILRSMGHEADARSVIKAKYDDLRKYGTLGWFSRVWSGIIAVTIGYGYKTQRAFYGMIFFVSLGALLFSWADSKGIMQPSKERIYMDVAFTADKKIPDQYPQLSKSAKVLSQVSCP